jgi:hypothetical protein
MVGLSAWPFCSAGALWLGASPSDKGGSAGTAPFKRSEDMVQEDLTKAKAALKQEFNSFHKAFVRFCLIGLQNGVNNGLSRRLTALTGTKDEAL